MKHEDLMELLPLRALGVLQGPDASTLDDHLRGGCDACASELLELESTTGMLAYSVPPVTPPASLRARILEAARADALASGPAPVTPTQQVWKSWAQTPPPTGSLQVTRANEGDWQATTEGVDVKRLSYDAERRIATMLIRMAPGAAYPPHRHSLAEECYVIAGDLHIGDLVLHAGDFQRAEAASVHVTQFTESGCLLFITSSLEDELIS